ncbi:MAG: CdaR family protein [Peptacetobacter hiranonis]|uniref:CdaR family protein n=1 Tax=Peptacetobacter hiranonis TaxID=89152 RepID=UPI0022E851D3|nr:CdaR family protein [Peptacetobacter hiranonis]MED9948092.1 CdaR family protein [Peptacetobacter hiranonis]
MMRLKNNTKVKLIALFSAIALWMYVIAIVDPEDTKLIEDIPVTVSNLDELEEKDLVIYPDESLLCSMNISGKLSNVKNIDKDDIKVYGEIDNPIEGKNEVYLRANMSERVSHEFTQSTIIVNLEKKISKNLKININVSDEDKENIDSITPENDYATISGPRTQMNKVKNVVGKIDSLKDNTQKELTKKVRLIALDENGKEVKGVEIENPYVYLKIKMLDSKDVPIKVVFNTEEDLITYKLSEESVTITGKVDTLKNIQYVETETINIEDLKNKKTIEVNLVMPNDVKCEKNKIRVSLDR